MCDVTGVSVSGPYLGQREWVRQALHPLVGGKTGSVMSKDTYDGRYHNDQVPTGPDTSLVRRLSLKSNADTLNDDCI